MKAILVSLVTMLLVLFSCGEKERDVCLDPLYRGNEHSFYNCPCVQKIEARMEKLYISFAENKQRIAELSLKNLFSNPTESNFDERKKLRQQNKVIIYKYRKQQNLLYYHKDRYHYKIKLTTAN